MTINRPPHQPVSEEELASLRRADEGVAPVSRPALLATTGAVDRGFKHRNVFFFAMVVAYSIKLIFYPAGAPRDELAVSSDFLLRYAHLRLVIIWLLAATYTASYLLDWHFKALSWVFAGFALTALLADLVHAYPYLGDTTGPGISALIALHVIAVYLLLLHALNADRAPLMPRRPWS